ncbi:DUF6603 domain-containing protein [uncultured Roseobacter sp.]|uniref:DUF6603 domain-containing protein n=1 Tax=uncultured Roseobacter sp. TaxID=114847 RepID=UPI00261E8234|nr:DUF6603 domain-containing protein [uncultured Roseobacter sp.]
MSVRLEEVLLRELARLIEPLAGLARSGLTLAARDYDQPAGTFKDVTSGFHVRLEDFLTAAGLQVPPFAASDGPVVQLATDLQSVLTNVEKVAQGDATALASIVDDVKSAVAAIKSLAAAHPDLPGSDELAARITEHLTAVYVMTYHPPVAAVTAMLGVLDETAVRDRAPGQFDFAAIGPALADPSGALAAEMGFGTDTLAANRFLDRLALLLGSLDLQVDVKDGQSRGLPDGTQADPGADHVLSYELFRHVDPSLLAFLSLRGVPADGAEKPGLKGFIDAIGAGKIEFPLPEDSATLATFEASAETDNLAAVTIRPSGLQVEAGAPDIRLGAKLKRDMVLADLTLGPVGLRAETPQTALSVVYADSKAELRVELHIDKAELSLGVADADGFLASLLPAGALSAAFSPTVGWSSAAGFFAEAGGAGLSARIPTEIAFGKAFALQAIEVGVGLNDVPNQLSLEVSAGAEAQIDIGPVSATVEGIGVIIDVDLDPAGDGPVARRPRFKPPTGLGLGIDAGPVRGGGYLSFDHPRGRYAGALALEVPPVALTAFGVLDTKMPDGRDGWSLLLFLAARFPAIPLGFGFNLLGAGGIVGLNRDVDVDALFAAVRAGKAGQLLAPEDPVRDASSLIRDAEAIFPVTRGQHVLGPTVALGWGTPQQLLTLDLALALTLPEPLRIILIGTLKANIPNEILPIVKLNVDVAGVLDVSGQRFDLEGRIYDSRIQGIPIEGGFAVRSAWGPAPELAFSIGGLHPGFEPPPGFPTLARLGVDLSKGSRFKLLINGYFAITSNSLQFGAALDLQARAAGFQILAELGFDVLILLDPFQMEAAIRASAAIKRGGNTLCAVRLSGTLSGPGPWRARGSATIEILFFDVDVGFDSSFGEAAQPRIEAKSAWDVLRGRLSDAASWGSGTQADAGDLILGETTGLVLPDAPLELRQDAVPLDLRLAHFGGHPISGAREFRLAHLRDLANREMTNAGAVTARFAPGSFLKYSDNEKLTAPAFEDLTAGARFVTGVAAGDAVEVHQPRDLILIDAPEPSPGFAPTMQARHLEGAAPDTADLGPAARVTPARGIRIKSEVWCVPDAELSRAQGTSGPYAEIRGRGQPAARLSEVGQ